MTPERLSGLLKRRVSEVTVVSTQTTVLSEIERLRAAYADAQDDAPATFILRTSRPERVSAQWSPGRSEVSFYGDVAPALSGAVPRCFDSAYDADTGAWHVLLEDLTDSHFVATRWPLPPSFEQCMLIVAARARFHAAWWDDPRLGVTVGASC